MGVANVQLPYMAISLIVFIASGFIVSKFGSQNLTMAGIIISTIGFVLLFMLDSTEFLITISLPIIATGLTLSQIGSTNMILLSAPKQSDFIISIGPLKKTPCPANYSSTWHAGSNNIT